MIRLKGNLLNVIISLLIGIVGLILAINRIFFKEDFYGRVAFEHFIAFFWIIIFFLSVLFIFYDRNKHKILFYYLWGDNCKSLE